MTHRPAVSIAILGVALLLSLSFAGACECEPTTIRSLYSRDDVKNVILGKIIDEVDPCPGEDDCLTAELEDSRRYYKVEIEMAFKGCLSTMACSRPNTVWISSAVFDGLCGVQLKVGTSYVLNLPGGRIPQVALCYFPTRWIDLDAKDIKFLKSQEGDVCTDPSPESLFESPFEIDI